MEKIKELKNGNISVAGLASLLTEVWGNMSIISHSPEEEKILYFNTTALRNFIRGRRDSGVINYDPMPLEIELEKIELFYFMQVVSTIFKQATNGGYILKPFDDLWSDFSLISSYKLNEDKPTWHKPHLHERTKSVLAEIILERLKTELDRKPPSGKKRGLVLYLNLIRALRKKPQAIYKKTTRLLKKYDPKNESGGNFV